jgi:hypothetical protein
VKKGKVSLPKEKIDRSMAKNFGSNIKMLFKRAVELNPEFSLKKLCRALKITSGNWYDWTNRGSLPKNVGIREKIVDLLGKQLNMNFTVAQLMEKKLAPAAIGITEKPGETTLPSPTTKEMAAKKTNLPTKEKKEKIIVPDTKKIINSLDKICEELTGVREELNKLPKTLAPELSKSEKDWLEIYNKLSPEKKKEVLDFAQFQASRK